MTDDATVTVQDILVTVPVAANVIANVGLACRCRCLPGQ